MQAETRRACGDADAPHRLELELVTSVAGIRALATDWRALERRVGGPTFFQSYGWCGHVAETLVHHGGRDFLPIVAVGRRDDRVVAIWPLSAHRALGGWVVRTLDDPFGQLAGLLAVETGDALALVEVALGEIERRGLAGAAFLERVPVGGPLHDALVQQGAAAQPGPGAPWIDLAAYASIEELRKSRNRKSMKNLRNARNRLRSAGEKSGLCLRQGADLDGLIRRASHRRRTWLGARGMSSPSFRHPRHLDVLLGGGSWGLDVERIGFELRLDGHPIAEQWGFVHGDRYYAYMSAFDPAYEAYSPGKLHLALVVEQAMSMKLAAMEMLTPASDYKMVWTDASHDLVDMTLVWSRGARLRHEIWHARLRPGLKALYYALPTRLASSIAGMLHTRGD